jgi:hypothetical protein
MRVIRPTALRKSRFASRSSLVFRRWWAERLAKRRRHASTGSTEWTPAAVAGLKLWVRIESLAGTANNAAIASWPDESGNGHHLVQATVGSRPHYDTTVDGSPAVLFDGVDDVLATAGNVLVTDTHTIFVVVRPLASDGNDIVGTGNVGAGDILLMTFDGVMRGHFWAGSALYEVDGSTFIHAEAYAIFEQETDAEALTIRLNGSDANQSVLDDPRAGAAKPIYLGSRAGSWFYNGCVRALLVYEGNPSEEDKQRIRDYLVATYNIPVPYPDPS